MLKKGITKQYMTAIGNLYGDVGKIKSIRKRTKRNVNLDNPYESQEQIVFITWLKKLGYIVQGSANGEKRDLLTGIKLKNMGVSPGFPDIFLPYARKGYSSLFIEMKRKKGGVVSQEQKDWGKHLEQEGFAWHVTKGADEAKKIFCEYMDIGENNG